MMGIASEPVTQESTAADLSRVHAALAQQVVFVLNDPARARDLGLDPDRLVGPGLEWAAFVVCTREAERVASGDVLDLPGYRVAVDRMERAWGRLLTYAATGNEPA